MKNDFNVEALAYISTYGADAGSRVRDDISRAIGTRDWDEAHRLQRVQLRIIRLKQCENLSRRLTTDRRESYAPDSHAQ